MTEPEKPVCPHCGKTNAHIAESRRVNDRISQRRYRCHDCLKYFYIVADCQFHWQGEELVYELRLKPGNLFTKEPAKKSVDLGLMTYQQSGVHLCR